MTPNELLARLARIEAVQNKLATMVGNDVKQLAAAIQALQQGMAAVQAKCVALENALRAVAAAVPERTNGSAHAGATVQGASIVDSAPEQGAAAVYSGLTGAGGTPLGDMNEEDAQIMLTGGED